MRFNDFKLVESKKLYESANAGLEAQHAMHDIEVISDALPNIPEEEEANKQKLVLDLKKIQGILNDFVKKAKLGDYAKETPTTESVETEATDKVKRKLDLVSPNVKKRATAVSSTSDLDQEAQDILQGIMNTIKMIEEASDEQIQPQFKKQILDQTNQSLDQVTKKFTSLTQERDSARAERDEAINFVKEVTGVLVTLGNKVQGYTQEDPNTMNAAQKKKALNADKFTKTLKQALFGKILDMQEDSDVTGQEIKEFLEACVAGKVINMLDVIGSNDSPFSKGNIKNHVNPKYQKVFDVFVEENIFSYAPGTTSGAIGPGEMALSMMGNPAEKGKKGDLKIGNEEVEIKASAKTGGRFNSKAIAKATTGWKVWAEKINEIMQSAPKGATMPVRQKDGTFKKVDAQTYNGNQYNVIKGKAKNGSKYNWNQKGFDALNNEVLEPYANKKQTADLFISTIKALVQNYDKLSKEATNSDGTPNTHHKPFKPAELIIDAINNDGTVDMKKMNIAYSKIAYASYHLADGITTVMLLRTDTLDYTIFRNADALVDQMSADQVQIGGGFNWNDDQQTPSPGYVSA